MSTDTAAPSTRQTDRVWSIIALIGIVAVVAVPVMNRVLYVVPVWSPTPFYVVVGSLLSLIAIAGAYAALIGGIKTVERVPSLSLLGAGAALVGGVAVTVHIVEQFFTAVSSFQQSFGWIF